MKCNDCRIQLFKFDKINCKELVALSYLEPYAWWRTLVAFTSLLAAEKFGVHYGHFESRCPAFTSFLVAQANPIADQKTCALASPA
jgi:hypothetical protein